MNIPIIIFACITLSFVSIGTFAEPNVAAHIWEFPHVVSFRIKNVYRPFCAGVILSPWHILTVAKCVDGKLINQDSIGVHPGNANSLDTSTPMHTISRVVIHPSYTGTLSMRSIYEHNIAVVILNEAILLNTYQNRIALPRNEPPNLVTGVTSGWGLNSYSLEQNPGEFAKSDVTILNSFHCTQMLPFLVNNGQICAMKTNGVSPTDVGGPLVYDQRVVGLLSYVRTSPRSDPGIYTSVHYYLDFIKSVIAP